MHVVPTIRSNTARGALELELRPKVAEVLRSDLAAVADEAVAAIMAEVPAYAGALSGRVGAGIRSGVRTALGTFLEVATGVADPTASPDPALQAAFGLGGGEARAGRSVEALLAAYRVGARVSWRHWSQVVVAARVPAADIAKLAELVFSYIDELSAASAAGHAAEVATAGRQRERRLEDLARSLLSAAPEPTLLRAAEQATWPVPRTLTAVLVPVARASLLRSMLDDSTLMSLDPLQEPQDDRSPATLLVPDADGPARGRLAQTLSGCRAILGPARPWVQVAESFGRTVRTLDLIRSGHLSPGDPTDTEDVLAMLVLSADPGALHDLRERVLAPLGDLTPGARVRLIETLRAWTRHQGRRDSMAGALFVHPQTIRYRMGQLRQVYGDHLDDAQWTLDCTIALAGDAQ